MKPDSDDQREIRAALRESPEKLSPGFYARARSRFEESRVPASRRWFRPISWETAGLLAAAALAVALFLPSVVRREVAPPVGPADARIAIGPARATPSETRESIAQEREEADEAPRPVESTVDRLEKTTPQLVGAASPEKKERQDAPVETQDLDVPRRAPDRAEEFAPVPPSAEPPPPARTQPPAEVPGGKLGASKSQPERPPRLQEGAFGERERSVKAVAELSALPDVAGDEPSVALRQNVETAFELPAGSVEPGQVTVVETVEEWARVASGPAGPVVAGLERRGERLVLIGPRDLPVTCRGLRLHLDGESYVLTLRSPTGNEAATAGGCAVLVPSDGRPIVVRDPGSP